MVAKTRLMENQDELKRMADSIKTILNADVIIVDKNMERIYDTFPYIKGEVPLIRPLSVIGEIMKSGQALVVNDKNRFYICGDCPDLKKCKQMGIMGVPVFADGRVEGALAVVIPNQSKNDFCHKAQDIINHLEWFARLAGCEIERQSRLQQMNFEESCSNSLLESSDYPVAIFHTNGELNRANGQFHQWKAALEELEDFASLWPDIVRLIHSKAIKTNLLLPWEGIWRPTLLTCQHSGAEIVLSLQIPSPAAAQIAEENLWAAQHDCSTISKTMNEKLEIARGWLQNTPMLWVYGEPHTGKRDLIHTIHNYGGAGRNKQKQISLLTIDCEKHTPLELQSLLFGSSSAQNDIASFGALLWAQAGDLLLENIEYMPILLQIRLENVFRKGFLSYDGKEIRLQTHLLIISRDSPETLATKGLVYKGLKSLFEEQTLRLPPLRERRDDAIKAFKAYMDFFSKQVGRARPTLTEYFCETFETLPWNRNLQEIGELAEKVVMHGISEELLEQMTPNTPVPIDQSIDETEKRHIILLLQNGQSKSEVARRLDIGRSTLYRKIKKYGLNENDEPETEGNHVEYSQ